MKRWFERIVVVARLRHKKFWAEAIFSDVKDRHAAPVIFKRLAMTVALLFLFLSFSSKKEKKVIPPGTVQITETFFADEAEVTNTSWAEYEYWIKIKYGWHSSEHKSVLPDTLVWRHKLAYSEPYVEYYYRHPAYRDYPVVGVSHEQAVAYCIWRTERVKEYWYIKHKKELEVIFRLPTKKEWELISNSGLDIFNYKNGINEKGFALLNCNRPGDTLGVGSLKNPAWKKDAGDITAPVYSFWKNWFGLFNCFGNVSEMISEKGISKGGSWKHKFEECRAGKDIPYTQPESWLGFRCVCDMKK